MKVSELHIPDLKVFEPQIIDDDRGYFFLDIRHDFVQFLLFVY